LSRLCDNWLFTLREYIEDTESPRDFWAWSGLFILGSTLQRRVWLPFGMETIYPNLFIMFVAPPGWSRKGAPVGFAKKILEDIQIPVGIDSPTKRHLTKRLAMLSETEHYYYEGFQKGQAPLALVSKELSSFLAVDPKNMIEGITDLYDSHDKWDYGTSGKGEDILRNLCISCLFATTPDWIARNLPEEAIGGGFTSRFILVSGLDKYKEVPYPPIPNPDIYLKLKKDLEGISHLVGPFEWGKGALDFYKDWYMTIRPWAESFNDERLFNNFSRVHVQAIKTAMSVHIAKSDTLIIERKDMEEAIGLMQQVYSTAGSVFAAHGRSPLAMIIEKVIKQVKTFGTIDTGRLLSFNYHDATMKMLMEVCENLAAMKMVKIEFCEKTKHTFITWLGKR